MNTFDLGPIIYSLMRPKKKRLNSKITNKCDGFYRIMCVLIKKNVNESTPAQKCTI